MKAKRIFALVIDLCLMFIWAGIYSGFTNAPIIGVFAALFAFYAIVWVSVKRGGVMISGSLFATTAYACADAIGTAPATYTDAGDCLEEGTGIMGFLLIKKGFDVSTIIDQTTFDVAVTAKNLYPIKDIEAYWPKTSQVTIAGIAGRMPRHGRIEYELPFKHEGVDANLHFWNTVNNNRNLGIAYVTEEYKVFAALDRDMEPVLCSIFAAPEGDQEFGKIRMFSGTVKWKHRDLVQYLEYAGFAKSAIKATFQP